MGAKHFTELQCWQLSNEFRSKVIAILERDAARGDCSFCDDMRRCIRSAPRNIAEGFGRYHHREFHQFLKVARGSLAEAQDGLIDARESKYIDQREFGDLWELSERAIKATTGLMRYLSGSDRRRDRPPRSASSH